MTQLTLEVAAVSEFLPSIGGCLERVSYFGVTPSSRHVHSDGLFPPGITLPSLA